MNPLRETFRLLYANRLKRHDPIAAFRALLGTSIFAYLNLFVVAILADPFTGYLDWLGNHGMPTVVVLTLILSAICATLYLLWIHNGKLERVRARIDGGWRPRRALVYAYIITSLLALPASVILMDNWKT
jgi:hypothetical protein